VEEERCEVMEKVRACANAAQVERAVRLKHLREEIEEAKKYKTLSTVYTVLCVILSVASWIPPLTEIALWGTLVTHLAFYLLICSIVALVLGIVCAYLSEWMKRRIRELEIEEARLMTEAEVKGDKSEH